MKRAIRFKETQKFTQWWLWLIILAPIILVFFNFLGIILYVFSGYTPDDSGNVSVSWVSGRLSIVQFICVLVYVATILFLALSKLKVSVSDKDIKIHHLVFFSKVIDLNEVVEKQIVNYDFVGYGIRKTKKYGTVYNVKGKEGVAITQTNGKKYLFGSQKTEEFLKSLLK
ncbi:hypothetical protein PXC01_14065 [Maribacter sp. M208]|uniref:hypothetical protein n=1 Tax=Maribacter huludaoensis TaxID=3030010 RepID=UPI0023EC3B61|nr:hypothetical protein [Maribacter huludaoensis]MDF4222724.1 hypothetical protein [Maribacter huludaoensis]